MNPEDIPLPASPVWNRTTGEAFSLEEVLVRNAELEQRVQQLLAQGQDLQNRFNTLEERTRLEILEARNQGLQAELNATRAAQAAAERNAELQVHRARPVWPEKHNGRNSDYTRSFINAFRLATQNRPEFNEDEEKVRAFGLLLTEDAAKWFDPMVTNRQEHVHLWKDFEAFVRSFQAAFGIHNAYELADDQMKKLYQGRSSAAVFAARFKLLLTDLDYTDQQRRTQFQNKLRVEVQKQMLALEFNNFDEMVEAAIKIDQRLYRLEQIPRGRNNVTRTNVVFPAQPMNPNPVDPAPTPEVVPMEVDAINQRTASGNLTAEERARRMKLGLCLYCGLAGHLANACASLKQRQARSAQQPAGNVNGQ